MPGILIFDAKKRVKLIQSEEQIQLKVCDDDCKLALEYKNKVLKIDPNYFSSGMSFPAIGKYAEPGSYYNLFLTPDSTGEKKEKTITIGPIEEIDYLEEWRI